MKPENIPRKIVADSHRLLSDYWPALKERNATERIPPSFEAALTREQARGFLDTTIKPEQLRRLNDLLANYKEGTYHFRELAGSPEDGNRHPHDFIVTKTESATKIFFVDLEHSMGMSKNRNFAKLPRIGDLRPRVNVLYATELAQEEVVKIALIRYRSAVIPDDRKELLKPTAQLAVAHALLETGHLPEFLIDNENEITFRLDFRNGAEEEGDARILMQARAAHDPADLQHMVTMYTHGHSLSPSSPLEGQMNRYRSIMRTHLPKHLEADLPALNTTSSSSS